MKRNLEQFIKKIKIWHVIIIILLIGTIMSLFNLNRVLQDQKNSRHYSILEEWLDYGNKTKIKVEEIRASQLDFWGNYTLKVKYKEDGKDKDQEFYSVPPYVYKRIEKQIRTPNAEEIKTLETTTTKAIEKLQTAIKDAIKEEKILNTVNEAITKLQTEITEAIEKLPITEIAAISTLKTNTTKAIEKLQTAIKDAIKEEKILNTVNKEISTLKTNTTKAIEKVSINNVLQQSYKEEIGWTTTAQPLLKSLQFCFWILLFYYIYNVFNKTTSQFTEQFSDKKKGRLNNTPYTKISITFKDIAGAHEEKEEMQELVDFLKNPKKYAEMGARIPKGVLLSGPPGTGKTLLAKALAGEAQIPFFAVSGSEFVEMFVGLGAARIRNLFQTAQKNSPCIIFIDEIETLARKRGMSYGNSEQEQTLNQLLIELDGFNPNTGIIVIAATNQPDFLDPALLRPGRFDRRFITSLPSVQDREAILKLHAFNKKLDPQVSLKDLAKQTPGMSGAQLEGIMNEAALLATRQKMSFIDKKILSEAVDRILMGPAKKSRKYSEKEKKLVAYHESGHALIGLKLPEAKQIHKVTIIARGNAGGYNLMLDKEEHFFSSKNKLLAEITSLLGGRAAEEIFLDDISDGAYDDLRRATNIAKLMVIKFGMSSLGLTQYDESGEQQRFQRNFSEPKALEIDHTVNEIINNCYNDAKKIISENKQLLTSIAKYLLEAETLSKKDIDEIYKTGKLLWFEQEQVQNEDKKNAELKVNNATENNPDIEQLNSDSINNDDNAAGDTKNDTKDNAAEVSPESHNNLKDTIISINKKKNQF